MDRIHKWFQRQLDAWMDRWAEKFHAFEKNQKHLFDWVALFWVLVDIFIFSTLAMPARCRHELQDEELQDSRSPKVIAQSSCRCAAHYQN